MRFTTISIVILIVVELGIYVIEKWDEPLPRRLRQRVWIFVGVLAEAAVICCLPECELIYLYLLLGIFAGCMLLACITDSLLCQVYCFVWWIGMAVGVLLLSANLGKASGSIETISAGVMLLFFGILQYSFFGRTYGRADCHAFFACALVETALGAGAEVYFMHMILAYMLLATVQIGKRNASKSGKLLHPVPFLPYINLSFWVTLLCL